MRPVFSLFFCPLLLLFCLFGVPYAYDAYNGEKIPPLTRDEGRVNLTHEWVVHHGARMYWRSVQAPLQVKLAGMEFRDPADVPCLDMRDMCGDKRYRYRYKYKYSKKARKPYVKRKVKTKKVKPVVKVEVSTKPRPQRALGPVKPRNRKGGVATLPMKPVDPVGNPLQ